MLGAIGGINPVLYTAIYIVITLLNGVISFAWLLVMESLSKGSRGRTLAEYSFFGSIGGLAATLAAGLFIGRSYGGGHHTYST